MSISAAPEALGSVTPGEGKAAKTPQHTVHNTAINFRDRRKFNMRRPPLCLSILDEKPVVLSPIAFHMA
jgi:hypothetical protein